MPSIALPVSLRGQLLNSVRSVVFNPISLFAANEPGVWYDPSDVANLAWRRNLLTWTEQFDNAVWGKSNGAVSATADPQQWYFANDGVNTTSVLSTAVNPSGDAIFAIDIKADTIRYVRLRYGNVTNPNLVNIDAQTGATDSVASTNVGDGFYRFYLPFTSGADNTGIINITLSDTYGGTTVSPSASKRIIIRRPQFELGSTATEYQRITDVNTEVIERFPTATLYQDTAGTIPVTTAGQTVALALDKSKGLVLGSELVTNGTFDGNANGWTLNAAATYSNNAVVISALPASTVALSQTLSAPSIGRAYQVSYTISGYSGSGSLRVSYGAVNGPFTNSNGTFSTIIIATSTSATLSFTNGGNVYSATIDNISVKELPGFHATQATAASRPTYGIVPATGRRNLLTRTEEFNDAAWTNQGATVTANTQVAPDGTTTADTFTATAGSSRKGRSSGVSATSGTHTAYVYAKAGTHSFLQIGGSSGGFYANFDLSTGTVGTTGGARVLSSSIVAVGSWYQCVVVFTANSDGIWLQLANSASAGVLPIWTAVGTETIHLWGAQLETGSTATAYQRVGSAFDVTEAGVASLSYLSFDGVDDFLLTPTITPGTDKAQVFAGVRKLSDAAVGVIVETSANAGGNNGAFFFSAPTAAGAGTYRWSSRGTTNSTTDTPNSYAAPITNVTTCVGDISSDVATLRINGTQVAQNTGDQGTGNFLAYPLYIGRRGGTTLPFNGNLYSLIVRFGTNLDAGTITSTETWVNGKTGAY